MVTVHMAIGNSDDKLPQCEWISYIREFKQIVDSLSDRVHGVWYSEPCSVYKNCCIAAEVSDHQIDDLRRGLSDLRLKYRQDSVAMNISVTEFV